MKRRLFPVISLMMAGTIAGAVWAQTPTIPQPDRQGDYFKNEAPIQAKKPFNSPGSLWQVVSSGLQCRSGSGMEYGVTRQFHRGELLQADVGRGGSDEVLINATDANGKPWMRVRSSFGTNYHCYVRANRLYIQPYRGQ